MSVPRILVAGVGNIFLGDDAFGVEVVWELAKRPLGEEVRIVDFGIRGLDLAYALLDGYETVILVDAVPRGGSPGQLYVVEAEPRFGAAEVGASPVMETHRMDPAKVLDLVAAMGGHVDRLLVVGCEPVPLDETADIQPGLSAAAAAAVPLAVERIERLIGELLEPHRQATSTAAGAARAHPDFHAHPN